MVNFNTAHTGDDQPCSRGLAADSVALKIGRALLWFGLLLLPCGAFAEEAVPVIGDGQAAMQQPTLMGPKDRVLPVVTLMESEPQLPTESVPLNAPLAQQSPIGNTPAPPATRQIPPIVTSRPSVTDATITVPKGSLQFENGATYTDNSNGTTQWVLPETLARLGLTRNTELRVVVPNYVNTRLDSVATPDVSGADSLGDMAVGFSHHRRLPGKIDMALIPLLNIPTGVTPNTSDGVDPQVRVVVSRGVGRFIFSSMLDTRWNTNRDAPAAVQFTPTFITYCAVTRKLTGFAEWAATVPTTGFSSQIVQGGLLFTPTVRQQLDVRVGTGLNRNSPDLLVGFGYSFRVDGLF